MPDPGRPHRTKPYVAFLPGSTGAAENRQMRSLYHTGSGSVSMAPGIDTAKTDFPADDTAYDVPGRARDTPSVSGALRDN